MSTSPLQQGQQRTVEARAWEAVKRFRKMQPGLTAYASAICGRPIRVELSEDGVPKTDGKTIYVVPPIALGDSPAHVRHWCDKRDPDTLQQICKACEVREEILIRVYHEIAHNAHGTFKKPTNRDLMYAVDRAIRANKSEFAKRLQKTWAENNWAERGSLMMMSAIISPYLPTILNALEDARVDEAMFKARPGTRTMFDALMKKTFIIGFEEGDGQSKWNEQPLNSQAIIGVFLIAAEYTYEGWLTPQVEEDLKDKKLRALCLQASKARTASKNFELAFDVLARLKELGYCLEPEDQAQEEPEEGDPEEAGDEEQTPHDNDSEESDSQDDSGDDDSEEPRDEQSDDEENSESDDEGDEEGDAPSEEDGSEGDESSGDDGDPSDSDGEDGSSETDPERLDSGDADGRSDSSDDAGARPGGDEADGERGAGEASGSPESDADSGSDSSDESESESSSDAESADAGTGDGGVEDDETQDSEGSDHEDERNDDSSDGSGEPSDEKRDESSGDDGESRGDREGSDPNPGHDVESEEEVEPNQDPIDSGVDDGSGGVKTDSLPKGDEKDAAKALQALTGHADQKPEQVEMSQDELTAILKAIVQGLYFETASIAVDELAVFKYRDRMNPSCRGWLSGRGLLPPDPLIVSESLVGKPLMEMRRVLEDNQRASFEKHLTSGRINQRVLGKRAWNKDERLFQKKRLPGKRSYAVLIGIDISGSTIGLNLELAKNSAMIQAELCHRMGIDFAVYAHSANAVFRIGSGFGCHIYEIKAFDRPWSSEAKLALADLASNGGNLDGHTIEYYRKLIETHNATDKVILYYTDGKMPAANYDEELEILQREIQICKKKKITLAGVGIRTDSPTRHGLDTVRVDGPEDATEVVRHLRRHLLLTGR